jgi:hypothetical protein
MDEKDKKAVIIDLIKKAAKKPAKPRQKAVPVGPGTVIQVTASGQAQAAGRDIINHHHAKPQRAPRVTVTPGDGVISEDQKVALTALRDEWITLHSAIKKRPLSPGAAWSRINTAAGATSYHLIQASRFDDAVAFIRKQMSILRSMASAPAKDKKWRSSRIGSIKARCANQLSDPDAYKPYIRKNFGADSLSALSTDELQRTYTYIMGKKTSS